MVLYRMKKVKGFIKPEDVGIQGRGGSDIVVKKNHLLLRSGKFVETANKNQYLIHILVEDFYKYRNSRRILVLDYQRKRKNLRPYMMI